MSKKHFGTLFIQKYIDKRHMALPARRRTGQAGPGDYMIDSADSACPLYAFVSGGGFNLSRMDLNVAFSSSRRTLSK